MKYKNFLLRAVNLLLILGVLWQYQQVALVRAAAVSQRKQEIAEVEAYNASVLQAQSAAQAEQAQSGYRDGTYEGSAFGFGDVIRVSVTIQNGKMTDIAVLDASGEDKPYYKQALPLLDEMLAVQSAGVDTVSGATLTAEGLIGAVEDALGKPLTAAQQRQRNQKRRTWLRAGVQLFFFVSMPGAFVAGFSGVKQIFLHIGAGEVLTADSFTLSLLGLCGFTLLFDRFFCGYACAFGSLGDAVWALSGLIQKKLFHRKKQLCLPERAVLWGQKVKYLLLAGLVALYVTRQEKLLTGASPWEVFSRLTALRLPPEGFGVGIALFVLILLGMALQPRFFCQFLCPMGAVFALLPVLPFARLHRQSDGCIPGCNACKQQCPVCLKLEESSLHSGECIACEACMGTCPKQNIHRWDTALCKCLWLPVLGKALFFFLLGCWLGFCRFI